MSQKKEITEEQIELSEIDSKEKTPTTKKEENPTGVNEDDFLSKDFPKFPEHQPFFRVFFLLVWVTFDNVTSLVFKGWKHTLKLTDIPDLNPNDKVDKLKLKFNNVWKSNKMKGNSLFERVKLFLSVVNVVKWLYFGGLVFYSISGITEVIIPQMMNYMLLNMQPELSDEMLEDVEVARQILPNELKPPDDLYSTNLFRRNNYYSFLFLISLIVMKVFAMVCIQNGMKMAVRAGICVRSVFISQVYDKSLKLSRKSQSVYTKGKIVNMVSVDTERVSWMGQQFLNVSTAIICFMAPSVVILIQMLGWESSLAGIGIALFLIPITVVFFIAIVFIRKKIIRLRDERVEALNEFLQGIRAIKIFAWEKFHLDKIIQKRNVEVFWIRIGATVRALAYSIVQIIPIMMAVACFSILFLTENSTNSAKIFVAMTYFQGLETTILFLPDFIVNLVQLIISLGRIQDYLNAEEIEVIETGNKDDSSSVSMENANFEWICGEQEGDKKEKGKETEESTGKLCDLNVKIEKGNFVVVCGPIGSGKSSFLHSIMGNIRKVSGKIFVNEEIGYCGQNPFIFNESLIGNILMGDDLDEEKFSKIVSVCQLVPDLKVLKAGRNTAIGEKGINLSGGQKARVALARACYADNELFLLDDPLSAVDAHVGKALIDECITSFLSKKTVILCSHNLQVLSLSDLIIYFENGKIEEKGKYVDLMKMENGKVKNLVNEFTFSKEKEKTKKVDTTDEKVKKENEPEVSENKLKDKIIEDEWTNKGIINFRAVYIYLKSMGCCLTFIAIMSVDKSVYLNFRFFLIHQAFLLFNYWWLGSISSGQYIKDYGMTDTFMFFTDNCTNTTYFNSTEDFNTTDCQTIVREDECLVECWDTVVNIFWTQYSNGTELSEGKFQFETWHTIVIYFGVTLLVVLFQFTKEVFCLHMEVNASVRLHNLALKAVSEAPTSWFDTTPIGRILNRFANVSILDNDILNITQLFTTSLFFSIGIVVIFVILTKGIVLSFLWIILVLDLIIYLLYRKSNVEVCRIFYVSNSPVYSHLQESINGVNVIRSYKKSAQYVQKNDDLILMNGRVYYSFRLLFRWVQIRIDLVGIFCTGLVGLTCIILLRYFNGIISFSNASLLIGISYNFISRSDWLVRCAAMMEHYMIAAERIHHYGTNLPSEKPKFTVDVDKKTAEFLEKKEWPSNGTIEFKDYKMRYRPDLPLVLKGINLNIDGMSRIGIVGRTGSGKSTLVNSIFRIIEPCNGTILIDSVDVVNKVGLFDLRSRISMIPQDPWLFYGSVRDNLDPEHARSDEKIWDSLQKTFLKKWVEERETNTKEGKKVRLESIIEEGGSNVSVGERQLLCLARAILKDSKILILDDLLTDRNIQKVLIEQFKYSTTIIIAHRLNTIIDCDKIVVMDDGLVVEVDTPRNLLCNEEYSLFKELVKETGEENELFLRNKALKAEGHSVNEITESEGESEGETEWETETEGESEGETQTSDEG